jgi:hypothetical protein
MKTIVVRYFNVNWRFVDSFVWQEGRWCIPRVYNTMVVDYQPRFRCAPVMVGLNGTLMTVSPISRSIQVRKLSQFRKSLLTRID